MKNILKMLNPIQKTPETKVESPKKTGFTPYPVEHKDITDPVYRAMDLEKFYNSFDFTGNPKIKGLCVGGLSRDDTQGRPLVTIHFETSEGTLEVTVPIIHIDWVKPKDEVIENDDS